MIIAIDGPAASGKSVTAKDVAKKLKYIHINTGSMYRAVTLYFLEKKVNLDNGTIFKKELKKLKINFNFKNEIFINDIDVSNKLRQDSVNNNVSKVSAVKVVRDNLVALQRNIALDNNVVMEGRDIGTTVFPNADFKFYLTADIEVRAKRRLIENQKSENDIQSMIDQIKKRDNLDKKRKHSPLVVADGAIIIDTTNMKIADQVEKIVNIIKRKDKYTNE
ncbi:MAG: cytidylate kinase [Candidatus Marinimicrobia bacterium]|nr:cytidylate kinase [Candidatus Neomarinimicrobiota bacterium]|tara:strand:+ start:588 stop:1247 length:660 start_codon:yes stop_codon:yes gene_type:complete